MSPPGSGLSWREVALCMAGPSAHPCQGHLARADLYALAVDVPVWKAPQASPGPQTAIGTPLILPGVGLKVSAVLNTKGFSMDSLLNSKFLTAVLAAVAAGLVSTGVLPREVSDAHIAQASTLLMALIAIWQHGKAAGSANTGDTTASATNAAVSAAVNAAEHAVGEIVTAALAAIETATPAPAPAPVLELTPARAAAPAPAVETPAPAPAPVSPGPVMTLTAPALAPAA